MSRRRLDVLLVAGVCVALAAALLGHREASRADARVRQLRAVQSVRMSRARSNRVAIAVAIDSLCTRFYSQVSLAERLAERNLTPRFYRFLQPDLRASTIRRLVVEGLRQVKLMLAEFDPRHCADLPTHRFLPAIPARTG